MALVGPSHKSTTAKWTQLSIKFLAKGIHDTVQLAAFYELGQGGLKLNSDLLKTMKKSKGVGVRLVLSDRVLWVDWAYGAEGSQTSVWFGNSC